MAEVSSVSGTKLSETAQYAGLPQRRRAFKLSAAMTAAPPHGSTISHTSCRTPHYHPSVSRLIILLHDAKSASLMALTYYKFSGRSSDGLAVRLQQCGSLRDRLYGRWSLDPRPYGRPGFTKHQQEEHSDALDWELAALSELELCQLELVLNLI